MSMSLSPPVQRDDRNIQEQPRKRRRVALACDRCRDRKIKCDGTKPTCGSCQQLWQRQNPRDVSSCTYQSDVPKFVNEREYIEALHSRIRQLEQGTGDRQTVTGYPTSVAKPVTSDGGTESNLGRKEVNNIDVISSSGSRVGFNERVSAHPVLLEEFRASSTNLPPSSRNGSGFQERILSTRDPQKPTGSADINDKFRVDGMACSSATVEGRTPPSSSDVRSSDNILSWSDANTPHHKITPLQPGIEGKTVDSEETISAMGATAAAHADSPISGPGFYGASSAISFFNQIQDALSSSVQSGSGVVHQARNQESIRDIPHSRRFLDRDHATKLQDFDLPPRMIADFLLDSYWDQVHSLYPIVHKSSFLATYGQLWVPEEITRQTKPALQIGLGSSICPTSVFYCGLNAMLALGCNLSDMPYDQRRTLSDTFCQRSLDLARGNLLDNSSLGLVQALFILGQYLQCTDNPTRCWNVVGLSLRVAQGIGLYMDRASSDNTLLETEIKRRTWHGCLLLDIITSMTLGRPALASREANVPLPAAVDDIYLEGITATGIQPAGLFSENMFFVQTLKLYAIFGEVLTHVYKPWQDRSKDDQQLDRIPINNIIKTVVDLERDLLDFKSNLPHQLNWDHAGREPGESWLLERQRNILYTRFLHLKVLLYRPVFHQLYVQPRRNGLLRTALSEQTSSDKTVIALVVQRCSCACIESAQALIDFVDRSSQTKAAGAWWYAIFYMFTSAMILILAGSDVAAQNTVTKESIESSWQKCLGTLDRLALKHVRARACAKTLVKLREQAIAAQTAAFMASDPQPPARAAANPTNGENQQAYIPGATNSGNTPVTRPFYEDAVVEFYDPLLQDVLWQQPNSQLPWDLQDDDWWQGMLERP